MWDDLAYVHVDPNIPWEGEEVYSPAKEPYPEVCNINLERALLDYSSCANSAAYWCTLPVNKTAIDLTLSAASDGDVLTTGYGRKGGCWQMLPQIEVRHFIECWLIHCGVVDISNVIQRTQILTYSRAFSLLYFDS